MPDVAAKVVLVTGAARGIGLATAKRFLVEGWRVALLDIGMHSTGLVVYDGESMMLGSSVPIFADRFTRDVAAIFRVSHDDAESLKQQYGCALLGLTSDSSLIEVPGHEGEPAREAYRSELNEILEARAEELFALGRKQFPGHPWILRNWAQLDIDLGKRPAAYQKFDEMEKLDPLNTSLYTERLRFTPGPTHDEAMMRELTDALVEIWGRLELELRRAA